MAAFGAAAVLAASDPAIAETARSMHPPKYKDLQDACGHCVATANDCLRHCIGMMAMKDYSMTGCINTTHQVVFAHALRFEQTGVSGIN